MTQVKICGITNLNDARVAAEAGADLLGFIFYPRSPRYIAPDRACKIVTPIQNYEFRVRFVGVFVNESLERVRQVMHQARLDLAQLHGSESAEMVQELTPRVYKSLRPRDASEGRSGMEKYRSALNGNTPAFIVDAFNEKLFGGTGERGDWNIAAEIARDFPILLAGGLNPQNVAEAIRTVHPWGVDVSSGVERVPGVKDRDKVWEFIRNAKR